MAKKKAKKQVKQRSQAEREKIIDKVLELMTSGECKSCRKACKKAGVAPNTFLGWVEMASQEIPPGDLVERYARAREQMIDSLADEILEIADTPQEGERTKVGGQNGTEITTEDMLGHRKLQVDARKWLLSKLAPSKYGDKLEIAGDENRPLAVIIRGDDAKL